MSPDSARSRPLVLVYAITVAVAACSLLYELLIAQTLTILAGNTVVWYSLTVGTYLGSMGCGALLCHRVYGRRNSWSALFQVEILLTALGAAAVPILHFGQMLHAYLRVHQTDMEGTELHSILVFFGVSFAVTFLVGLLTGFELPLLMRLGDELSTGRPVANRVLALDYLGSLLAGLAFPLVLLTRFEMFTIGLVIATLNLVVGAILLLAIARSGERRASRSVAVGLVAGLFLLAYANLDGIEQYFLKKYYYYWETSDSLWTLVAPMSRYPRVERYSSPYQKIDIVRDPTTTRLALLAEAYSDKFTKEPSFPRGLQVFLNGDHQFSSADEEFYHEYFVHVPILLRGEVPTRVLVLGAGDGLLIRELLKYPQIREIVHVDLDPVIVHLAKTDPALTAMNHHSLDDPRVRTIVGDGYAYVRKSHDTFDAIFMDFPYVLDHDLSKLYSREFYHFVRQRLATDGYAVLDATGIEIFTRPDEHGEQQMAANNSWQYYYPTIRKAGFETVIPYMLNLEADNAEAIAVAEAYHAGTLAQRSRNRKVQTPPDLEERERTRAEKSIAGYVFNQQEGFIIAMNGAKPLNFSWRDPGVPLHVLNEKRFHLAFDLAFRFPDPIDPGKVNSIMRPTLPELDFLWVRLPWY